MSMGEVRGELQQAVTEFEDAAAAGRIVNRHLGEVAHMAGVLDERTGKAVYHYAFDEDLPGTVTGAVENIATRAQTAHDRLVEAAGESLNPHAQNAIGLGRTILAQLRGYAEANGVNFSVLIEQIREDLDFIEANVGVIEVLTDDVHRLLSVANDRVGQAETTSLQAADAITFYIEDTM